ncbi:MULTISPECIES: anti-sigma factor family protein [Bremerella]|uniref:anti-sigma factor family protein n=1 Tax=Bremerella TaxID=2714594 RepID=UPI0031EF3FA3
MTDPTAHPDETTEVDELLAAYLDNELSETERSLVETRLAEDDSFRNRLDELDRAWDMLEALPKADLDDEKFVRTTVEMITVAASQEIQQYKQQQKRSAFARQAGIALAIVALIGIGYMLTQYRLSRPDRILVEYLPVIERVDEFERVDNIEFLEALRKEGLFTGEASDES